MQYFPLGDTYFAYYFYYCVEIYHFAFIIYHLAKLKETANCIFVLTKCQVNFEIRTFKAFERKNYPKPRKLVTTK